MTADALVRVRSGERIASNGIEFTYSSDIADIVASTVTNDPTSDATSPSTAEQHSTAKQHSNPTPWEWLAFGRVLERSTDDVQSANAGVLCGRHGGRCHALVIPLRADTATQSGYQAVGLRRWPRFPQSPQRHVPQHQTLSGSHCNKMSVDSPITQHSCAMGTAFCYLDAGASGAECREIKGEME